MADTEFHVHGPFDIDFSREGKVKRIQKKHVKKFWAGLPPKESKIPEGRGCYVFGIRIGDSVRPEYVGMTEKAFKHETFHKGNCDTYNDVLFKCKRGTPVFYFVSTKTGRGNVRHITYLEIFLIQNAAEANPDIKNIQRSGLGWKIAGVLRKDRGPTSKAAKSFRNMLEIGPAPTSRRDKAKHIEGSARVAGSPEMVTKLKATAAKTRKTQPLAETTSATSSFAKTTLKK